ncbi:hypothetical protein D3Y57_05460 [Sphingomonas paeninsulae]|uniref:Uncharacterized protein n=1 Tax=Sphingomonas paeninsulae TaxID=2319844 RepID=A0A494T884_SPHPE|nr:hypothetical protein D3Y57_05460 [Sphingomonas paeninsulae]
MMSVISAARAEAVGFNPYAELKDVINDLEYLRLNVLEAQDDNTKPYQRICINDVDPWLIKVAIEYLSQLQALRD